MCVYSAARLPPANASKHTVIIQCLFSILVTWYVNMFWYWQCISTECASLPLSACLKGFHLAYTMAHICFVCGTLTMHTDVIWQHWNICSISALARLFGSTCPGTCTLDTVGAISVLFSLLTSVYMCVCVCVCVFVCVCVCVSIQVKWMMYWIVFALFTTAETATDLLLSWWVRRCSWSWPSSACL